MKQLVVSIHDVSPLTQAATETILQELHGLGVTRTSLLVVPNHHHHAPFLHQPDFCEWLAKQVHLGHEPVVHGYFHQRARHKGESSKVKVVTRFYTADEGEFYDLAEREAREFAKKAQLEFAQIGLHPAGFIAPAWLLSTGAERALRGLGFDYTTRLTTILDFKTNATFRSQSLVWSARSAWRRATSLVWNAVLNDRLQPNPLLRIGIHPPDFQHSKIRAQIRALISRALADRQVMTYLDWVIFRREQS